MVDNTDPVIELIGNDPWIHPAFTAYNDAGVSVTDNDKTANTSELEITCVRLAPMPGGCTGTDIDASTPEGNYLHSLKVYTIPMIFQKA